MPKSKVRKKNDFTVTAVSRTPVKVKVGPSSVWFVALFIGLMLIGLVWLMVFQLAAYGPSGPRSACIGWRTGSVELCDRVRFHDHRLVAHDALALSSRGRIAAHVMHSFRGCFVSTPATFLSPNHTRVIHPHC